MSQLRTDFDHEAFAGTFHGVLPERLDTFSPLCTFAAVDMGQVSSAWFPWSQGCESSSQQIPSFPECSLQENLAEACSDIRANITKMMKKQNSPRHRDTSSQMQIHTLGL